MGNIDIFANNPHKRFFRLLLTGTLFILVGTVYFFYAHPNWYWKHYPVHSLIEGIGACVAISLAIILFQLLRSALVLSSSFWVACALLSMGLLDGFHALMHAGKSFVWLHSSSNFIGGILFAFVWLPESASKHYKSKKLPILLLAIGIVFIMLSILFPEAVPTMKVNNQFTITAKLLNIVGGIGFMGAFAYFAFYQKENKTTYTSVLANLCFLFGISGILFDRSALWDSTWWAWHFIRFIAYGLALYYIIVLYQMERKRAEEERERLNTELVQKNKELEEVVYVISHDLRSPLVNIDGYNKVIGKSLKELGFILESNGVSAEVKEKIDVIVGNDIPHAEHFITSSVLKMQALLSGLLQISRLGRLEINTGKLNMNEIVTEILDTINYQAKKAEANIEISELPSCTGDENQINQLFSNLIGNAIKYLDSNRNGVISVSGKKEGDSSVYCIEDNGIGISPDHHEKIFEIFNQLNPKKSTGEGLGLSIVQKIVDIHHGKIWVDAEPGKGSKFYVSLPKG